MVVYNMFVNCITEKKKHVPKNLSMVKMGCLAESGLMSEQTTTFIHYTKQLEFSNINPTTGIFYSIYKAASKIKRN